MIDIDWDGVTNVLMALTALIVAVEAFFTKITHNKAKEIKHDVEDLKNGGLKKKVKEALEEHKEETDNG